MPTHTLGAATSMPYDPKNPPSKTKTLTTRGRRQFVHVLNSALAAGDSEEVAHRKAWGAVRNAGNRKDQKAAALFGAGKKRQLEIARDAQASAVARVRSALDRMIGRSYYGPTKQKSVDMKKLQELLAAIQIKSVTDDPETVLQAGDHLKNIRMSLPGQLQESTPEKDKRLDEYSKFIPELIEPWDEAQRMLDAQSSAENILHRGYERENFAQLTSHVDDPAAFYLLDDEGDEKAKAATVRVRVRRVVKAAADRPPIDWERLLTTAGIGTAAGLGMGAINGLAGSALSRKGRKHPWRNALLAALAGGAIGGTTGLVTGQPGRMSADDASVLAGLAGAVGGGLTATTKSLYDVYTDEDPNPPTIDFPTLMTMGSFPSLLASIHNKTKTQALEKAAFERSPWPYALASGIGGGLLGAGAGYLGSSLSVAGRKRRLRNTVEGALLGAATGASTTAGLNYATDATGLNMRDDDDALLGTLIGMFASGVLPSGYQIARDVGKSDVDPPHDEISAHYSMANPATIPAYSIGRLIRAMRNERTREQDMKHAAVITRIRVRRALKRAGVEKSDVDRYKQLMSRAESRGKEKPGDASARIWRQVQEEKEGPATAGVEKPDLERYQHLMSRAKSRGKEKPGDASARIWRQVEREKKVKKVAALVCKRADAITFNSARGDAPGGHPTRAAQPEEFISQTTTVDPADMRSAPQPGGTDWADLIAKWGPALLAGGGLAHGMHTLTSDDEDKSYWPSMLATGGGLGLLGLTHSPQYGPKITEWLRGLGRNIMSSMPQMGSGLQAK